MEYNLPSEIVKDVNFGDNAKNKIIKGVEKLAKAVKSTLGASGKCVIYEDARGKPVITIDAGDGTTTATVLAEALIKGVSHEQYHGNSIREIKNGIDSGLKKVNEYLEEVAIDVKGDMLKDVSAISCNNDAELGQIIAEAYEKVGKDGVVLMETSETDETSVELVDGVQLECGLTSPYFVTNTEKHKSELENPLILIVSSEIPNIRKIQNVLEHVIKKGKALLIVAPVAQQVKAALTMNKVKGNIKVNIIDLPGFGPTKKDAVEDLAILTGATVINEELGDDLDLITIEHLGEAEYASTDDSSTVITLADIDTNIDIRIEEVQSKIKNEKNGFIKKKLEERLAMLSGSVGIVKVGAASKIELKEKKDRIEDAIYATKAALKEGIVPGGGVALLNASQKISTDSVGEEILMEAIRSPFNTILKNAGLEQVGPRPAKGIGVDVVTGEEVNMIDKGIVDPVLVTKSALKNAVSVVSTIISADCVISNIRIGNGA